MAVNGNAASRVFYIGWYTHFNKTVSLSGLTITNGRVSGDYGGGIYNNRCTLTLNNCTLGGNSADYDGGGIFNDHATLTVSNSTLSGNSNAAWGGGIYSDALAGSATVTIANSTLSGNWAWAGGVVFNEGFSGPATLTITNSTLSGNSAAVAGGIYNHAGSAMLTIGDTILKKGAPGKNIVSEGTVISLGYNLSSDAGVTNVNGGTGDLVATGDQINTDPMLGPLQDNGGPTFTHAPLTGSPAIDAGKNFTADVTDQRGSEFVRTFDDASTANATGGDATDIGAFEVQPTPSPTPTPTPPAYAAQIQQPINADGTSVFKVRRGVVPVKFSPTLGGVATCDLPPATIAVTRTAGGVIGPIDESLYGGSADSGSNFRIDSCQYVYNLSSGALGPGTYRVDISIGGSVVGSGTFGLK